MVSFWMLLSAYLFYDLFLCTAGTVFGLFGSRTNKYGRDPIVLMGYVLHMAAFYLIFINLPSNSPVQSTTEPTYIQAK